MLKTKNKKRFIENFFPDAYVKSVGSIDFKKLYIMGFRGLIFDIDGTFVPQDTDITEEVKKMLIRIKKVGFAICFVSNNYEDRIKRFLGELDFPFVADARKPRTAGYNEAIKKLRIKKNKIICIGDQIFTDILSANRFGFCNILVDFIRGDDDFFIGKRRWVEGIFLKKFNKKHIVGRIGDPTIKKYDNNPDVLGRNFCNIDPRCYAISHKIRMVKRKINDLESHKMFSKTRSNKKLPNLVIKTSSIIIKKGQGKEFARMQRNKAINIKIASKRLDKLVVRPGEVFSFWNTVGKISKRDHYREGRIISNGKIIPGIGGGLCLLGHSINWIALHSPMEIIELHRHSDSLNPEPKKRTPFNSGTAIEYNYIDYRFKNDSDQEVQICVWCKKGRLFCELRSERPFLNKYELEETNCYYRKQGEKYYKFSKIYRNTLDRETGKVKKREKLFDNYSEVMYDEKLIPKELIRE